jgi:hypothetical protein
MRRQGIHKESWKGSVWGDWPLGRPRRKWEGNTKVYVTLVVKTDLWTRSTGSNRIGVSPFIPEDEGRAIL